MDIAKLLGPVAAADTHLAQRIVAHQHSVASTVLPRLSNAANHSKLWLGVAAASAAFGGRRGRRAAQRGLLSVAVSSVITNGVLKPLFPRLRPPVDNTLLSLVRRPLSSSFPSGHSASAAAYATATAMEAPAFAAPVAALAAGVAYSRISNGVHYPSDVIAGMAVGAAVALGTSKVWPRIDATPATARPAHTYVRTEPSPMGSGLTIVVNAAAGPSAHESEIARLREAFPEAAFVSVEDPTTLADEFRSATAGAAALGVLGGDGTIGAAAAAAIDAGIPLAVFPGGTLNHFARDLGVDGIEAAISAVQEGQLVEVDVGTIDGRAFLNTASFGTYSAFVEAHERFEDTIGKWPAAMIALVDVLRKNEPFEAVVNGTRRTIWMIFIGNCSYDPPGFVPATRDRLDDGRFDVRIVDGSQPNARLRLITAVITGRLARCTVYTQELVDEVTIETTSDHTLLAADGETFTGSARFQVTKAQGRLRTYAPHE